MNRKKIIIMISIAILVLLTGCEQNGDQQETLSAEKILTAVAETVSANLSLTPPATATFTATATATATMTETPTATATATSSPTQGSAANPGGGANTCDNAVFVSDVTIPDGTAIAPGATFTKTWRIKNNGSCTWNASYAVSFLSGTQMGGTSPQLLTAEVLPGSSVDISVALTAPATAGSYTGYWQIQNAAGTGFAQSFYVQIQVTGNTTSTVTATPTVTPTGPTPTPGAATGKPDLRISSVAFDPSPQKDANFTIKITVENAGDVDAGASLLEWWPDASQSTSYPINVGSIPAKSSTEVSYSCACYDSAGTFQYKLLADAGSVIDESDETNNTKQNSITVTK